MTNAPKFRVKFHDGPAAGIEMEYDREMREVRYFAWMYENTYRREGDYWLFVVQPKQRAVRKILPLVIKAQGKDPRLDPKPQPNRVPDRGRNAPCWCGSGKKFKKCHGGELA